MAVSEKPPLPQDGAEPGARTTEILADVLCAVDGTRGAYEAVRQAAVLSRPEGHLTLLAVAAVSGTGAYRTADIAPARARQVLDHARRLTRKAGVEASILFDERGPAATVILEHAAGHGLLALGAPAMSRLGGVVVGAVATRAAHTLPVSLLVARRPPSGTAFAGRILVASDGLEGSDELVGFAIALARRCGASLQLLHVDGEQPAERDRLLAQGDAVGRVFGEQGRLCIVSGRANQVIVETAARERASLLVVSSRRLAGLRALGSVSERVVHDAPCSVLVVRAEDLSARP